VVEIRSRNESRNQVDLEVQHNKSLSDYLRIKRRKADCPLKTRDKSDIDKRYIKRC